MADEYVWLISESLNDEIQNIPSSSAQAGRNQRSDSVESDAAYNAFFQLCDDTSPVHEEKFEKHYLAKEDMEKDKLSEIVISPGYVYDEPISKVEDHNHNTEIVQKMGSSDKSFVFGGQLVTITARLITYLSYSSGVALHAIGNSVQYGGQKVVDVASSIASSHPLRAVGDCAVESFGFTVSRTKAFTNYYALSLIADDPEYAHKLSLRSSQNIVEADTFEKLPFSANITRKRLFLPSLTWLQRELLYSTCEISAHQSTALTERDLSHYYSQVSSEHTNLSVADTFNFVSNLINAAEIGDHEAIHLIRVMVTPPPFHELTFCSSCFREFSSKLFRHHCRNCGNSFCSEHAFHEKVILRFGYTEPVRVCLPCSMYIDAESKRDRLKWLLARIVDYTNGNLIPYFDPCVDRKVDKAMRVIEGTMFMIKSIAYSLPARMVIETVDILRRYGLSGLAGVLMRQDFMEAAETLKRISGMDKSYPMSLHELTACIYYKIAIERGLRGCDPDGEHITHIAPSGGYSDARNPNDIDDEEAEESGELKDSELDEIMRFAPMALLLAYEESAVECQRIASLQGWDTITVHQVSEPEKPGYAIYATKRSSIATSDTKEVVVVIRGTHSVHDLVTDIRAAPHHFPPKQEAIRRIIGGPKVVLNPHSESMLHFCGKSTAGSEEWEWLPSPNTKSYACGGILQAAIYILSEVAEAVLDLHRKGYKIRFVGHSLGGAVGALVTYMLLLSDSTLTENEIHCFSFASPSCVDELTATKMAPYVTNVVLRDDVVPRLTPTTLRLLLKDLLVFRREVFRHVQQDWKDVIMRAGSLWSPRWREAHAIQRSDITLSPCDRRDMSHSPETNESKLGDGYADEENDSVGRGLSTVSTYLPSVGDIVLIDEKELIQLFQPGKIAHIYSFRGIYRACFVPSTFATLRKIEVQGNMFRDHKGGIIFESLQEVRTARRAICEPPRWVSYDGCDSCSCCRNSFTWHSTFRGEAQEYRERYNCRSCGALVCDPCSINRQPVPRIGLNIPSRICDTCFFTGAFTQSTNPLIAEQITTSVQK